MIAFRVDDMTCGHCVSTITRAVKVTDKEAKVTIDLGQHLVMVEPTEADAEDLRGAIAEVGFTPVQVDAATATAAPAARSSGCCGSCH